MSGELSQSELARYSRQIALPQVGPEGQQRLREAHVVIVGAGGLGAPVSLYLASAGVGSLTLVDGDTVELSNLQRQVLFRTGDVGRRKADVAAERLRELNDTIAVSAVTEPLNLDNVEALLAPADLVIDCCDNFPTRYLINDFCCHLRKPWLFAAVHQFRGHFALFTPETACFRCLYPETPITEGNCSLAGVMGVVPGLLGLWQANEAIKFLLGLDASKPGLLWQCDALNPGLKAIRLIADPDCWCAGECADLRTLHAEGSSESADAELDWDEWTRLEREGAITLLVDMRAPAERRLGDAGGVSLASEEVAERAAGLTDDGIVGVYCQRGQRSLFLVQELRARGYHNVYSLRGGYEQWSRRR